jgi:hypothetical protein
VGLCNVYYSCYSAGTSKPTCGDLFSEVPPTPVSDTIIRVLCYEMQTNYATIPSEGALVSTNYCHSTVCQDCAKAPWLWPGMAGLVKLPSAVAHIGMSTLPFKRPGTTCHAIHAA